MNVSTNVEVDVMLTYQQAASMIGVPVGTLYAWVHNRAIPHVRLGARLVRFRRGDLRQWLEERTVDGHRAHDRKAGVR